MAAPKFETVYAVVAGGGSFPLDMLRYDRCVPYRSEDASGIEIEGARAVVVTRYAGQPGRWTPDRWSSFLWGFRDFGSDASAAIQHAKQLNEGFASADHIYPELVGFRERGEVIPPPKFPDYCPGCGSYRLWLMNDTGRKAVYSCKGEYTEKPQIQNHTDKFWGSCPRRMPKS